jgi:DNA modification methylase
MASFSTLSGGSGTTILAAERTGRIARVIELDAAYVDVAVRRWQAFTGKTAILAGTQITFDARAEQVVSDASDEDIDGGHAA